jgi:hypothetical protein
MSEGTAIGRLVGAWETYFDESTVAGIQAAPGSYSAALSSMASALTGLSGEGAAAAKIQAGIQAFWSGLSAVATAVWVTAPIVLVPPVTPPAGLTGLSGTLASTFAANQASELSLPDAASAVASVIHAANAGGAVPGSVPPASPAPIPIL